MARALEPMLKPEDVSKLLDVPVRTLADWRTDGRELPFHRFGGRVRYHPRDVQEYLDATRHVTVQAAMETTHGR